MTAAIFFEGGEVVLSFGRTASPLFCIHGVVQGQELHQINLDLYTAVTGKFS